MNFRKLLTYLAFGTAAVIPFATAQNPTILQGSYISNVFGQSNFIKNPNAQTNLVNVTTVTATVTRSTTTPLVATSEFTVAIGTANGTATWSTRTFDAGMKNNNCEARFSYRGFAATSKVDIKQGANTVASLNLTPATDPRIASINFPCGDLSTATTFVVTDTSTLAGTNEIGGIYVGLATNMANVAQAEFVGAVKWATATSCFWAIGANVTTYGNFAADADCTTPTSGNIEGQASAPSTKVPGITFSNLKPGRYIFTATGLIQNGGGSNTALGSVYYAYFRFHDGTNAAKNENASYMTRTTGNDGPGAPFITGEFEYSAAQSNVTIQIQGKTNSASPNGAFAVVDASTQPLYISVYRFPTASELVVTPERQNTWAGVIYTAENQTLFAGVAAPTAPTPYTSASWNQPTKLKGKASVTTTNSGNDLGFSVANLPVGNYKFDVTGILNSEIPSVGGVHCNFRLIETNTNQEIAAQLHGNRFSTVITRDFVNAFTGVFNNTSVATRNFRIEAQKVSDTASGNGGSCQAYSATIASSDNTKIAIIMTPLDQPSNSALYVQGPVLGAQTGAAIPAGYQGQMLQETTTANGGSNSVAVNTATNVRVLTLPPGVWLICGGFSSQSASYSGASRLLLTLHKTSGTNGLQGINRSDVAAVIPGGNDTATTPPCQYEANATSVNYYLIAFWNATSGGPQAVSNAFIQAIRLN